MAIISGISSSEEDSVVLRFVVLDSIVEGSVVWEFVVVVELFSFLLSKCNTRVLSDIGDFKVYHCWQGIFSYENSW